MGTNLDATYALVQTFQPLLKAAGSSSMILISSVAGGPLAGRSGSLYAASKAALNQLSKSWACEWAGDGIRVNSVAPWVTLTELGQQVMGDW
jgi:Tropinone reductase 1